MKELAALRYWNVKGQKKLWQEVYNALPPVVRTEYDELGCFRPQNKKSVSGLNTAPCVFGMDQVRGGRNCMNCYGGGGNCRVFYAWGGGICLNFYRRGESYLNLLGGMRMLPELLWLCEMISNQSSLLGPSLIMIVVL